jgi:myxalamid-type polyketide synthase MxaB
MVTNGSRADELSPIKRAYLAVEEMQAKLDAAERARREPIAIVGLGCRFPGGAADPEAFWRLLRDGVDAVREVPPERWDVDAYYDPDPDAPGKMNTRWGGFLDGVDQFDASFFGIAPREAANMDPQHRLLLEVAWEALEHAGQAPRALAGSRTGVFVGIAGTDYEHFYHEMGGQAAFGTYRQAGIAHSMASGRLAYLLGLHGPCVSLDTACSSSLVAVHLACQSLRQGECDLALSGGINLVLRPDKTIALSKLHMMASRGRCRTFDAAGDGYVRGEGCGVVVLKRLSDAVAQGDRILAVIRGTAINQDGASSSLTAPNGPAQEAVIREALANGGVAPHEVSYVEAHGTGTVLGDPIEVGALAAVFGPGRSADTPVIIGSTKTNIGHLETAAGIAGLIKTALALQHGEIPPHLHLQQPNPHIPWDEIPIMVPTARTVWQPPTGRRIAGVSSFGFSGTNAHVVVEEAPAPTPAPPTADRPLHLLALSARTEKALGALAARYERHLAEHPEQQVADVCYTANAGRSHVAHRLAVTAADATQLRERLAAVASGTVGHGAQRGAAHAGRPKIAFLFTGQGSQYVGMGCALYDTQPTFRAAMDRCAALLGDELERPLLDVLYPRGEADRLLDRTDYTQPALFALEYALAELWRSWGIEPAAVLGHSVGEYAAACVAGVLSVEDALRLVAARGRLMQALPAGGAMVALDVSADRAATLLAPFAGQAALAAVNGPAHVVVSGAGDAVRAVAREVEAAGGRASYLTVSHAFHSPLMDPMLDAFEQAVGTATLAPPRLRLISNVTARTVRDEVTSPGYWREHVRAPVQFAAGIAHLGEMGYELFVEIGPTPTLLGMARACVPDGEGVWLPSLRRGRDDWEQLLSSLGELYTRGVEPDWGGFDRDYARRKLSLPAYPFERQRYWLDDRAVDPGASPSAPPPPAGAEASHPYLGRRLRSALKAAQFEAELSCALDLVNDHRIYGAAILPGVVMAETMLAAAKAALGPERWAIEDLAIQEALVVPDGEARTCQTILTPDENGARAEILSLAPNGETWTRHATATLVAAGGEPDLTPAPIADIQARCSEQVTGDAHYARCQSRGFDFGPSFRAVEHVWRRAGEALGRIRLPVAPRSSAHVIHPVLIDAAGQLASHTIHGEGAYVPVGIERLRVYRAPAETCWAHVVTRPGSGAATDVLVADIRLLDDEGRVLAEVVGWSRVRARPETLLKSSYGASDRWLYEVAWRSAPRPWAVPRQSAEAGSWLVFADTSGVGETLAQMLAEEGQSCHLVSLGGCFAAVAPGRWRIDPSQPEHVRRLLAETRADNTPLRGVVYLASLDAQGATDSLPPELATARRDCGAVLGLVQALVASGTPALPGLWLVTRGAQPAAAPAETIAGATLWGMGKVLGLEQPDLRCVRVDLDPAGGTEQAAALFAEIWEPDGEDQVAIRDGVRHVARLARLEAGEALRHGPTPEERPVRLEIAERGVLENLSLVPTVRPALAPHEVEIRVRATGLNFKDVLNALGMLPGTLPPLGLECAGTITAVGADVADLHVGDAVVALAPGSLGTFATTPAELVVPKPDRLSVVDAAASPVVFLTAYYGLHHLARLQPGERVLIHAAAGGVGLAAVQLALRAGAEVFATAGSPEKRAFLQSVGVRHVMNSRTLDFADAILAATGGEGVDIVLNSLTGEFIPASLAALRDGGRFLEIGKRGIWSAAQVAERRPQAQYFVYDLGEPMRAQPALLRSMLRSLLDDLATGALRPLPTRTFALDDAPAAFRHMAQAKHIGKIVLEQAATGEDGAVSAPLRPDGTYLITGGLGGLGLVTARWLVERGARNLVLVGRRGPSTAAQETIDELMAAGARIVVHRADVARRDEVAAVLAAIDRALPPLRGIVHAAGVLDDGVLWQQTAERFDRVLAPKADGAWHLHELTREHDLDFFVLFSSVAAVLGSPGQGNYAAANSFLDALAHQRRALGLPALSINWGPWAEVGMMAALTEAERRRGATRQTEERTESQGLRAITPAEGPELLDLILRRLPPQVMITPVRWPAYLQRYAAGSEPPFLAELAEHTPRPRSAEATAGFSDFRARLAATPPEEQRGVIGASMRQLVGRVLGLDPSGLEDRVPLSDMGLDSLMAVELKNWIGAEFGVPLSMTVVLGGPSIAELAALVAEQLGGRDAATARSEAAWPTLVTLQRGRPDKLPLFGVHTINGDVFAYEQLVHHLRPNQPFYALRARGMDGVQLPATKIEAMAADYVEQIRAVQLEGPYCLVGYSFGGAIAFEMARQLTESGHKVGLLALVDHGCLKSGYYTDLRATRVAREFIRTLPSRIKRYFGNRDRLYKRYALLWEVQQIGKTLSIGMRGEPKSPPAAVTPAQAAGFIGADLSALPAHYVQVLVGLTQAWQDYVPRPYAGRLTLFRAERQDVYCSHDPQMGWGHLAAGGVDVRTIPGSHSTIISEPHVQRLARELSACLANVRAGHVAAAAGADQRATTGSSLDERSYPPPPASAAALAMAPVEETALVAR